MQEGKGTETMSSWNELTFVYRKQFTYCVSAMVDALDSSKIWGRL